MKSLDKIKKCSMFICIIMIIFILQIQLLDRIEEIQKGKQKVDLTKWGNGDLILRIVADNAEDGSVDFTWE